MLIFNQVINVGFNQLIPRFVGNWYQHPKRQQAFLAHVIFWQILLSIGLVSLVFILLPTLVKVLNYPHPTMILLSALGAVCLAFYNYLYFLFVAKQQFSKAGLINVLQSLLKLSAFLLIIYFWRCDLLAVTVPII
jgi:flagellar biosynthesis protein FlhB